MGPTQCYVLLGANLSLVCGSGLDSIPQATITWTAPDGTIVNDNARFDLENGSDIVRFDLTYIVMSDNGIWTCDVTVRSERYVVSDRRLILGH